MCRSEIQRLGVTIEDILANLTMIEPDSILSIVQYKMLDKTIKK